MKSISNYVARTSIVFGKACCEAWKTNHSYCVLSERLLFFNIYISFLFSPRGGNFTAKWKETSCKRVRARARLATAKTSHQLPILRTTNGTKKRTFISIFFLLLFLFKKTHARQVFFFCVTLSCDGFALLNYLLCRTRIYRPILLNTFTSFLERRFISLCQINRRRFGSVTERDNYTRRIFRIQVPLFIMSRVKSIIYAEWCERDS